ncbi:lysozyme [Xanthomonas virus PB119]|nr:lysozyme [Xanthomonas virus PB119]
MAAPQKLSNGKKTGIAGIAALIIGAVVAVEGGYVNNPKDPGGATNHGVTEAVARQHGYTGDMRNLSKEAAQSIYYDDYIKKPGFDAMIEVSPAVAWKLVDAGVNAGTTRPSRWFQQSLNALNRDGKDYPQLTVDGKVGPGTVRAYRGLATARGEVKACEMTIKLLDSYQAQHYVGLTNLKTFTVGWIDHRIGNVPLSKCKDFGDSFDVADPSH